MISDEKKEEVRAAADIVEVVSDYVKLKRSGSGYVGLCPYHDENTPSFNVTPRLGIFKCFGCGESGDVFKFVMDQEGVGFTESIRQLAERYGVFIPEDDDDEPSEAKQQREGILHALKFAGVYYFRNLIENPDAQKALDYLEKRGYHQKVFKKFGLGYAPSGGSDLWKAATNAGINEEYLVEADLIKPSTRGEGFYDTFRGRLMFPIFNPTGKVIAFAGRVLGNEKTAKYINSSQTQVYNKSEVVYGVNFARNEIRRNGEVILVEGYTDVITLNTHGIENVVASSGTSLTAGQMRILHRYGDKIVMIYDSDSAGQTAMKRGINIALAEGMEVQLLELPEGQDPDSFVKQFGRESFVEMKKEESLDFVDFLMLKAEEEGRMESPVELKKVITEIIEAIAHIPDSIQRQVYVQYLHKKTQSYRKDSDRELFDELDYTLAQKREEEKRSKRRQESKSRNTDNSFRNIDDKDLPAGLIAYEEERPSTPSLVTKTKKTPNFEKKLLALMILHGTDMVSFIGSLTNSFMFQDDEMKELYESLIERFKEGKEISKDVYLEMNGPLRDRVGDVLLLEQHSASDKHYEKTGIRYEIDKDPYYSAKASIKSLEMSFLKWKLEELAELSKTNDSAEKKKILRKQTEVQSKISRREMTEADELYPDPEGNVRDEAVSDRVFEYKMKGDK